MRNIIPILISLFAVACSGAPFESTFDALGGDAGASDAPEAGTANAGAPQGGGGSRTSGGSSATAGSGTAGKPTSGGAPSGGASVGGTGGAPVSTCAFDEAKLTAALPKTFVWQDFMYTNGEFCATCRDAPCGVVNVISWGVPVAGEVENKYIYYPNDDAPMVSIELGVNDGACTSEKSCGAKMRLYTAQLTVERSVNGWVVAVAQVDAQGGDSACLAMDPDGTKAAHAAGIDFGKEASTIIRAIEIPCN